MGPFEAHVPSTFIDNPELAFFKSGITSLIWFSIFFTVFSKSAV